jgi:hypothetical protein
MNKKVIAFSLWGENLKYTIGAIENAKLAPQIYPGWICRFYVANDVPSDILQQLATMPQVELIYMNEVGDWRGMLWRFYAADDPEVAIAIIRDTDSRLNLREQAAVDEWLASGMGIHIMRDSPLHHAAIMGGLWGARYGVLKGLGTQIKTFLNNQPASRQGYSVDQYFLGEVIYPKIQHNACVHDEFYEQHPFPTPRHNGEYVGEYVGINGEVDKLARRFVQESVNNPTKDFAIHYFNYGKLLQTDSKRQQEAIYCFRQAIKIKPDFAEAYDCLQYNSDIICSY